MHLARLIVQLDFQSNFISLAFVVLMIFSSFCQLLRFTSPPSVSQSAPQALTPSNHRNDGTSEIFS